MTTFNARTQRARLSAGWAHDSRHFHFARQHASRAPFADCQRKESIAEAALGVASLVAIIAVLALFGGAL